MNTDALDLNEYYQNSKVAIWKGDIEYSDEPPFHPFNKYPEYDHGLIGPKPNPAYHGVRSCLHLLGLDEPRYGTPEWNPLGEDIKPGDKVVIKPNFVLSRHNDGGYLFSIITHPSIIRAIVDYVYKALETRGKIIIADAPQMDCDFQELLGQTKLVSIQELYKDRCN